MDTKSFISKPGDGWFGFAGMGRHGRKKKTSLPRIDPDEGDPLLLSVIALGRVRSHLNKSKETCGAAGIFCWFVTSRRSCEGGEREGLLTKPSGEAEKTRPEERKVGGMQAGVASLNTSLHSLPSISCPSALPWWWGCCFCWFGSSSSSFLGSVAAAAPHSERDPERDLLLLLGEADLDLLRLMER